MKRTKILGLTLCMIICLTIMAGCGLTYMIDDTNQLERKDAKEFEVEKAETELITTIDIHTSNAEVEILEADNFYVEIDYLYWEEAPEYSIENGKLLFNDRGCFPNYYSIDFNLDNHIRIYLPKENKLEKIRIKDASGDVHLNGFITDKLDINVSYGDFTMKEAAALEADITLSSGNSKINDFQVSQLEFTNSYGRAYFTDINTTPLRLPKDTVWEFFNVMMSSGDVQINRLVSGSIDLSNSYGNIIMDTLTADHLKLELSSGNCELEKGNAPSVDVRNSYGNATLALLGEASDYSLDLDTSYGRIFVNDSPYKEHVETKGTGNGKVKADLSSGDIAIVFAK